MSSSMSEVDEAELPPIILGTRLQLHQERATVRYLGPVSGQQGDWVGVEWDDDTRGKNDGSTGGVRYFTPMSTSPTSSSFLRLEKLPGAARGFSVLDALLARYYNERGEEGTGDAAVEELFVRTRTQRKVVIRLIGEAKIQAQQSRTHMLHAARLVRARISHVGDEADLLTAVPNISEMDLTGNLIGHWSFVEQLTVAVPHLAILNLSDNCIQLPVPPQASDIAAANTTAGSEGPLQLSGPWPGVRTLAGLRALVLNNCGVAWQQVLHLDHILPNLEELHLCGNNITSLATTDEEQASIANAASPTGTHETAPPPLLAGFVHLKVLNLEDNGLTSWRDVARLAGLPSLSRLHLTNNPITSITYPNTSSMPQNATASLTNNASAATASLPSTAQQFSSSAPASADAAAAASAASSVASNGHSSAHAASSGGGGGFGGHSRRSHASHGSSHGGSSGSGGNSCASFGRVEALFLGGCSISDWASIDQLDAFPSLRELRISGNPVLALARSGGRYEVVGRVSRLTMLNGADVSVRERRDSELRYLQTVVGELEEASDADALDATKAAHPRLRSLLDTYGQVLATAKSASGGSSMASSAVELKLTCVAVSAGAKMGTQVKKLPRSVTLGALRLLLEKLFKVKGDMQVLFLRTPGEPIPESLNDSDDATPLSAFGVQDGYEVLVDQREAGSANSAAASGAANAAAAQEALMAAQLRAGAALQGEFVRSMGLKPKA